ncbi:hypothetical protein B0J18DRAFT_467308 [Chaetomium sp. MPI-SDFR-AT-0129]|nr:hypothetical protein B0J18DRAFT_467308 [Chaetomium sp. MPI-SDFR-AT-0129]
MDENTEPVVIYEGAEATTATQPKPLFPAPLVLARHLSGKPLPQRKSRLLNFGYRAAAVFGSTVVVLGLGVVGFFLYDASTYHLHSSQMDVDIAALAISPRRGGPKNLPILESYIDDDDTEEMRRQKNKPRLVVLGGGWEG